jgi:pilus assembly protein CpaF
MSFDIKQSAAINSVWQLVDDLSDKKGISEIIINDFDNIYIDRAGEFIRLNVELDSFDIDSFVQDVADLNNKTFDEQNPILDGSLHDGSRINIISSRFTNKTPAITIRKFLHSIQSFDKNPNIFGLNSRYIKFLRSLVHGRMNVIISGGTGTGKTTFLNLMMNEITPQHRVVTIEDTRELSFNLPNLVNLEVRSEFGDDGAGLSVRDLVKNTLRMRPDRIILGEIRGEEIFDLLQAMNTGHQGSFGTIHSNSPIDCLMRMENLFLLSGYDVPLKAVRYQISSAVDFIIQIGRDKDGKRSITQITELANMEGDRILTQDIFRMINGKLKATGLVPTRIDRLVKSGIESDYFIE